MNFQQFLIVLRARATLILVTLGTVVGLTMLVSFVLPSRYTATASIVIDFKGIDPVTGIILPAQLMPGYLATELDIIGSRNVAGKVVDALKLTEVREAKELFQDKVDGKGSIREFLAELLLENVKLEPSRESSLVNISYVSEDPHFSAVVANSFVDAYIATNLELKVEPARQTTAWFNEQTGALKAAVEKAQAKLSDFQQSKGIVATDERLDVENARLAELSSQLVGAQAQTYDTQSRLRQVNEFVAKGGSADAAPDVLANPVIQRLKADISLLGGKVSELSGKLGTNHPQYQAAVNERDGLARRLDEEMKTVVRTVSSASALAQQREGSLKTSLANQKEKVLGLKQERDELTVLVREVENAQRTYDAAMQRFGQTRMESQLTQTNVAVINRAIDPIKPSSPRIILNLALSIMLGTMLGVGVALIMEVLDRRIRSADDLGVVAGIPVLGVLEMPRHRMSLRPARGLLPRPGASVQP